MTYSRLFTLVSIVLFSFLFYTAHTRSLPGAQLFLPSAEIKEEIPQETIVPVLAKQPASRRTVALSWADSVLQTMTPDERIGQLFVVYAYSNKTQAHVAQVNELVSKYRVGGLIFFQGGPVRQAVLTNQYQSLAKVPLLVSIDGEWGLGMRLDSTMRFPFQMALGAVQDDSLIYEMGAEIGRQCRRIGIHANYAPVVDINSNPINPVINARSFGESRDNVVRKAIAYMKGMQDHGVLACAKHFPGHGDTDKDSHLALPVIQHSRARLDSVELYPFKKLIQAGVGSIMVAHLYIPAYDTTRNMASSLSGKVVTDLLKKQLGYNGLVFTDALSMKGVSEYNAPGKVDVKALLAGNDILLCSDSVPAAIAEIRNAVKSGEISQQEIDQRCLKVLQTKYSLGLHKEKPIDLNNLVADLNTPQGDWIKRRLVEASLTLLSNEQQTLPLKTLEKRQIASLSIGSKDSVSMFQQTLSKYAPVMHFNAPKEASENQMAILIEKLSGFNTIIIGIHGGALRPSAKDGLSPATATLLKRISLQAREKKAEVILCVFANPYNLSQVESLADFRAVLMGYEDTEYAQNFSAQAVFGGISTNGRLPVTIAPHYKLDAGTDLKSEMPLGSPFGIPAPFRFKYTVPEEVGIASHKLKRVDSLVRVAIQQKAIPGCEVLAIKDGKVFYQKSFGYHTYDSTTPVRNTDIYDLASVTKVSTAIPALMKLSDEGRFDVDKTLGFYIPKLRNSNKDTLTIREILAHQAGLKSWIPFWKSTVDEKGNLLDKLYSTSPTRKYSVKVAENLYLSYKYSSKQIFKEIKESPLGEKRYVYSDLSYYLYPQVVERIARKPFTEYLAENFYKPLGATTLGYNPLDRFPREHIVPTEYDSLFRGQLLYGTVHDEGAAMLGGVSSHAGLFGNANDLAKLMAVYLYKGMYGGHRYVAPDVIAAFTRCQYCGQGNRRAIGFDRPTIPYDPKVANVAPDASPQSFGHSGFTGTFVWVDPAENFIYIFLSNRVYPTRENNKLGKLGTRTAVQQVFYEAMR